GLRADVVLQASSAHQLQAGIYAQSVRAHVEGIEPRGAFAATRSEPSWYVQDRWTPTGRLTVTAGVRVDGAAGETVAAPRLLVAGPAAGGTVAARAREPHQRH